MTVSITKDAKTSDGIFKVHKIRERGTDTYYYEIPHVRARQGFPVRRPDRPKHHRRRIRRADRQ